MALNLDVLESAEHYCSSRRAALVCLRTLRQILPSSELVLPNLWEGMQIKLAHSIYATSLILGRWPQGQSLGFRLWRWRGERSFWRLHLVVLMLLWSKSLHKRHWTTVAVKSRLEQVAVKCYSSFQVSRQFCWQTSHLRVLQTWALYNPDSAKRKYC